MVVAVAAVAGVVVVTVAGATVVVLLPVVTIASLALVPLLAPLPLLLPLMLVLLLLPGAVPALGLAAAGGARRLSTSPPCPPPAPVDSADEISFPAPAPAAAPALAACVAVDAGGESRIVWSGSGPSANAGRAEGEWPRWLWLPRDTTAPTAPAAPIDGGFC